MVPISEECVCKVFFRLNIVNIPIFYNLRLIRGTADRGTTEAAEPSTEPEEMTVLLQLPIKKLVAVIFFTMAERLFTR